MLFSSGTTIKVNGMSCAHCEKRVEKAVSAVPGVKSVKANAGKGEVLVDFGKDEGVLAKAKEAIAEAGYEVVG